MKIKTLLFVAVTSTTALFANENLSGPTSNNPVDHEYSLLSKAVVAGDIVLESQNHNGLIPVAGSLLNIEINGVADNIGNIKDGDAVKYDNVDLTNIVGFSASIASNKVGDHTITMYLDNGSGAPGTAIGTVTNSIGKTGGWQTYITTATATLSQAVTGKQTVYFVFNYGGQFNIDYFTLINSSSLSVSDNTKEPQISFYPNPVVNTLTIEMQTGDYNQYTLLDVSGKVIKEAKIQSDVSEEKLNVSDLSKGVYLINLKGLKSKTFKFIKE